MTRQQGSTVYAEAARRRGDDIRLMASIETIGWYSSEAGSQSYPPLFKLFYPNRADFIGIVSTFTGGNAAACGGVSSKFGFPTRDRGDVLVYSRSLLERSSVVLAPGLSRRHDHGYGIPSLSTLSRAE
jgi:hypothetical protein